MTDESLKKDIQSDTVLFDFKSLVKLVLPLVAEQFLLMSVGMADTVMVTTAGESAVSGVSLVDNINLLLLQIFAALSTGGAVVVSQYIGRNKKEDAKKAAKQLLYTVTVVSLVIMLLALVLRRHILTLVFGNIEESVMQSALSYFLATAVAYPFMAVYNAGAALFRSIGNSKVSMFNSLIVNIVNIGVNAVLIYGFNMGALGAGIGTLVSRIVAAVFIVYLWQRKSNEMRIKNLFKFEYHAQMVRQILSVGIPNGLENGLFQIGKILVLSLITSFGTNAVAANAIASSVAGVINVPGQATGLAMITVVGRCMGARRPDDAVKYTKKLMFTTYLSMGVMCAILFSFAEPIVSLFHLTDASAVMACEVLKYCSVFTILFWPVSFSLPNSLRAAGDAVFTMAVSFASMFICRLGLSYVFGCDWGLNLGLTGVWFAMFTDWIFRGIFFVTRFIKGKWKTKTVI